MTLSGWRLEVDGKVRQPSTFSFDYFLNFPSKELFITMECAGNSPSYVTPPADGLAFRHGAVSTARWKGIPLNALLEKAGIEQSAVAVMCPVDGRIPLYTETIPCN